MRNHIWESGDTLLFWGKVGLLLELEVANGSRECQVSVDSSEVDKAASGKNPRLFA